MAGRVVGPLHGVPWAPKDLYSTRGVRTTGGSKILADSVPSEDATVVARLARAGAILLGKLNMHEFAYGPEGLNAHYGDARNPWSADAHRITGGSSSGSGAAVAAGLAPGSLGSDTGGSIRIPASLCGITGLKPTYGRVSRAGVLPLAWSMDHVGPMTRSARDCALMLSAIAGYDPADPTTSVLPVPDYGAALTGDVKGLRVGLLRAHFTDAAASDVRAAVEADREAARAGRRGRGRGESDPGDARRRPPPRRSWRRRRSPITRRGCARGRRTTSPTCASASGWAPSSTGRSYVRAQQIRALVTREVDEALARRDVLLAPATPLVAPVLGERETTLGDGPSDVRAALLRCTRPFNFSGHPACAAPCGFTAGGPADRIADRGPSVRRGDGAARRRRLSAHDRLAYSPPGGRVSGFGPRRIR